jgi:PAS domain-containing protein
MDWMARARSYRPKYRYWRTVVFAGLFGFAFTLLAMEVLSTRAMSLTSLTVVLAAMAGSLFGVCVVGAISGSRIRRRLGKQNLLLDAALRNMNQGLCMFDAQNRLLVWNERYRAMYNIDRKRIWRGCTIRDLLDARIAAGTFPLNPERYDAELRAALKHGKTYVMTIELADGRVIDVVNQPIKGGGWVATHEDISERRQAGRELEQTRAFLDTIIENVPSPIIVKGAHDLRYLLINRAAEQYLGVDRNTMLGKRAVEVMPQATAEQIEEQDRKLIAAGTIIFRDEHAVETPGMARASSRPPACRWRTPTASRSISSA